MSFPGFPGMDGKIHPEAVVQHCCDKVCLLIGVQAVMTLLLHHGYVTLCQVRILSGILEIIIYTFCDTPGTHERYLSSCNKLSDQ